MKRDIDSNTIVERYFNIPFTLIGPIIQTENQQEKISLLNENWGKS